MNFYYYSTTGISYCTVCVFALLISKVSLQVVGIIGGSVLLPCASNDTKHERPDINVCWRHNGTLNVYDITKGNCSEKLQKADYKNRAKVFPDEYENGNFSLKLNDLIPTDAGEYQCFILHSSELVKVQLLVNVSKAGNGDQPAETRRIWISILVLPFVFLLFFIVCVVIIWKKRDYKTSGSKMSAPGRNPSGNSLFKPLSNTSEPAK
nr:ICOS ligand-like [Misgurnus anguillicaudatus]